MRVSQQHKSRHSFPARPDSAWLKRSLARWQAREAGRLLQDKQALEGRLKEMARILATVQDQRNELKQQYKARPLADNTPTCFVCDIGHDWPGVGHELYSRNRTTHARCHVIWNGAAAV